MLIVTGQAAVEGTPFGRYRLVELLGRGGMGEVWRAYDTELDRIVGLKRLLPHFTQDKTFEQRFRREARAAARLDDHHVVPIYDVGEIDGWLYVTMKLIEGRDVQTVLADGPLDPARAVRIVDQVAKALHAAHKVGLVHRDVTPRNILLDRDDIAYLIDFGIARGADETGLTGTGGVIGSWPYMAPERFRAGEADARADIYALACVLYECLTGRSPFPGDSFESQFAAHVTDPPPQPSTTQPNVPAEFDAVIAKGMAKEPDNRYATTVELADAARDAITAPISPPKPSSPARPAAEPAPVPTAPPTIAAQHEMAPPDNLRASAPTQHPPQEMPTHLPEPAAEQPPPTPPSRMWWQRKAVFISAASIVTVLATVLAVALATTGNHPTSQTGQTSQNALPDAAILLNQSAQITRALESAHLVLSVAGKIQGLPIKVMTTDLTTNPAPAASGNVLLTLAGSDIDANFVVYDSVLYATLTPNKWSDFGKASDIYDVSAILNPNIGLPNVLANFTNAKAEGRETINGQSTIKISGNVSADAVNKIAAPLNATQPLPSTVWIQETGDHQLVQFNLQKSPGNSVQMTLSNWNQPVTVTKPPVGS
jgi:serine/threonine protein kinase